MACFCQSTMLGESLRRVDDVRLSWRPASFSYSSVMRPLYLSRRCGKNLRGVDHSQRFKLKYTDQSRVYDVETVQLVAERRIRKEECRTMIH